jgi:predicted transcriptional regulator
MATRWDERFFSSTRGRLVLLLRRGPSTVDELAQALELKERRVPLVHVEHRGLDSESP